jgi:hypothetical protein
VDGALPWVAKLGDACDFVDMIDMPSVWSDRVPERLGVEWATTDDGDAHEVEAFVARDISPTLLASAFEGGVKPIVFRRVLEPTRRSPARTRFGLIWAVLALCLMVITGIATNGSGEEVGRASVKASMSSPPPEYSKPFTLEDGALVAVRINSNTNNSWLYAEVDLVDAGSGESLGFVGREVSYYHGVEGGESWSEGSRKWRETYIVPKGGRYKLRVDLSEAERKGLEVTATISTVWLDKRWPFRVGWFLFGFGVLLNLWALTGRKNLWPSDD